MIGVASRSWMMSAFEYLRAESLRLSADCTRLRQELDALRDTTPFDFGAHATYQRKLRCFRGLLANHRLALEWMQHPPCGELASPAIFLRDSGPSHRLPGRRRGAF